MVSVIMSTYNKATTIEESVDSILAQTFTDWELIIISMPSPDNTIAVARELAKKSKKIILLEQKVRLFPPAARNCGLNIARGKYIAILDDDDVALPERLEKEVTFLNEHHDIFLVGSGRITIDNLGVVQSVYRCPYQDPQSIKAKLPTENMFTHSSVMYRNEGYRYREKITRSQDYDLYLRLLTDGKRLANIEEPLVKYRLSNSSTSVADNADALQPLMNKKILAMYEQRVKYGHDTYDTDTFEDIRRVNENEPPIKKDWRQIRIYLRSGDQAKVRTLSWDYVKKYKTIKGMLAYVYSFLPKPLAQFIINHRRKV